MEVPLTLEDGTMARIAQQKFIAFHKGRLLPDNILDWIIDAATRGLMTASGKKLLLIPDTRKGPTDPSGLRQIGKFRKSDCLTLKQLIAKMGRLRLCQKGRKTANKHELNQSIKNRKIRSDITPSGQGFLHNASVEVAS